MPIRQIIEGLGYRVEDVIDPNHPLTRGHVMEHYAQVAKDAPPITEAPVIHDVIIDPMPVEAAENTETV